MPLPGLKPSIELQTEPSLQLIDRATGATHPLSETEARLLQLWDGATTATELTARLFVEGLDVEPWQAEQFFTRLARAGLMAAASPVVPNFVPVRPGVEQPEDTVPKLRGDLVISRSTTSRATLEVRDPLSERTFTLYDFEVSIARMLDGKRSAAEVLSAANRLGIPVTLATLKTFLQQLKAYKFIDETVTGGESTWPPRAQWTPGVRELYQGALRQLRQGKFDEALAYVDAMKEADPANEEALVLRQRIEAEARGSLELKVDFETLHTPTSTPAVVLSLAPGDDIPTVPFGASDPFASFGFHAAPARPGEPLPVPAGLEGLVTPVPLNAPMPDDEPALPKRSRRGLFIGLGVVALALAVVLRPVPATRALSCELQLEELAVPHAARAGAVKSNEVTSGAQVEKGAVLARLSPTAKVSLEVVQEKIATLEAQLAKPGAPPNPAKVTKAKAAVKKAQAAVAALEKQKKKAPKKQQAALEKKLKPKVKALELAEAALDTLTGGEARAKWKAELEALTAQKVAASVDEERGTITAPLGGLFFAPDPLPETVADDGPWGRIVATNFKVVIAGEPPAKADTAVFRWAGGTIGIKLENGVAQLPVSEKLVGAKGTLEFDEGSKPWLLTFL